MGGVIHLYLINITVGPDDLIVCSQGVDTTTKDATRRGEQGAREKIPGGKRDAPEIFHAAELLICDMLPYATFVSSSF